MTSKKTFEERIQEKDKRIEQFLLKARQYEAQKKQLEKQKKEAERKERTHRLIQIGGVVESVLGRSFSEGDDMRLMNFLKMQERNGKYFSKAMNREVSEPTENSNVQSD